jgi:selenocysteine-specific elongation factor
VRPLVIGTAGHIDHGKTTLVRAVTGLDTDRLPEEKSRGISIDLGFAPFTLPSGRQAAFVDVPGHERFVKNMVAGVHGMDAVILVVAADEGIMPQTEEHLNILTLLGVRHGLTALTKVDLVDADWRALVEEDVAGRLQGTFLADAPIVPVSSVSRAGVAELLDALDALATAIPGRDAAGSPRLPVDRVFTMRGFGTVVTGTLTAGVLRVEDALEVVPEGLLTRVRGLQVHGERVAEAAAGQRVAVNLGGVERSAIRRGQVLARPGRLHGADVAQLTVTLLAGAPAVKHRAPVHVHAGTDEAVGRLYWYDRDVLDPGMEAFGEVRLSRRLVLVRGDRVLLRSYSPVTTIGGGIVIEVDRHHRRREPRLLDQLAQLAKADPLELAHRRLEQAGRPLALLDLAREADVPAHALSSALAADEGFWVFEDRFAVSLETALQVAQDVRRQVQEFQSHHPLRPGLPRESLKPLSQGWDPRMWAQFLSDQDDLVVERDYIRTEGFSPHASEREVHARDQIVAALRAVGLAPPPIEDLAQQAGLPGEDLGDFLAWMVSGREVVRVDEHLYVTAEAFGEAAARVREALRDRGPLGTSALREVLGTSRKYAVPLLERMDEFRITRRTGDTRVLGGAS